MMRVRRLSPPLSLLLACVSPGVAQGTVNASWLAAPADDAATAQLRASGARAVFDAVQRTVVHVAVEVDGPRGKFVLERSSSGIVVDAAGWVVTWRRLVREAEGAADKRLFVRCNDADNTRLDATIAAVDPATGLALLRVTPPAGGLTAVQFGPERPSWGEPVLVVARPKGEDMLAFAGVASAALTAVELEGRACPAADVFLTDARNDERCDGGAVFAGDGGLLGLYSSEHVQRDLSEPTLADLQRPSFGVVVPTGRMRTAFREQFAVLANATLRTPTTRPEPRWAAAVARVAPAVVSIWAGDGEWPSIGGDDPGAMQRRAGLGSGVVLTPGGLVVANLHVAAAGDDRQVRVRGHDGKVFAGEVVARHVPSNLALLRLELPAGAQLAAADCAPDDDVVLGETVLAVGNPLGSEVVVTAGVVSALREREGGRIQADANLGNQNGGGAVVDVNGRVLGIGDAGLIDPPEWAFKTRGDHVTQETNLSTFVGIRRVRELFGKHFAGANATIVNPRAADPAGQALRHGALANMVEQVRGAMLNVYVARNVAKVDADDPFAAMAPPQLVTLSLGSAVIVDPTGLALSNWHVVDDATEPDGSMRTDHAVTARTFDGQEYRVRVLSISREDDLSLLQLELAPGATVPAVALGSSDALRIAEPVAAIGNPHGRANTITFGLVSAKEQELRVRGRWAKLEHLIETDAAINGGNSGGALLDMAGRLVGINSAGGGTFNNKGYAIAVDHVRQRLLGLLLQPYKLRSPELGLRVLDQDGEVLVMDVDERGPAARAGVRSGERVVALGGTAITWSPGFALTLLGLAPRVDVPLRLAHAGVERTLTLAPLPAEVWALVRQADFEGRDFGYAEDPDRVRNAEIAMFRQFTGSATGSPTQISPQVVRVERVFPGSGAAPALQVGDLILAIELALQDGKPSLQHVGSVRELRDRFNDRALGSYDGVPWRCWIDRAGTVQVVEVRARRLFW